MRRYYVEVRYRVDGATRDDLDRHSDEVMDALAEDPNLVDPDVGVNFSEGTVDVCMVVMADDEGSARSRGLTSLRSAGQRAFADNFTATFSAFTSVVVP